MNKLKNEEKNNMSFSNNSYSINDSCFGDSSTAQQRINFIF